MEKNVDMKWKLGECRGLRNLIEVTMLGKPYYLLDIPIMETQLKFLHSNPASAVPCWLRQPSKDSI